MPQNKFPWGRGALNTGAGSSRGFGSVDYTDLDAGTPLMLLAGTWTPVERNLQVSNANFNLPSGPWAGFNFYSSNVFRARAVGDLYLYKFAYAVTPSQRGAALQFFIRPVGYPAFQFGPGPLPLETDAGHQENGSITFFEQARSRFVTYGGQVLVMMSCDGTLDSFSPEITPLGFA